MTQNDTEERSGDGSRGTNSRQVQRARPLSPAGDRGFRIEQYVGDDRDPQTSAILGAAIEVHKVLGRGFLEPVYQDCLAIEFARRCIPFTRETGLPILYKGERIASHYKADFVCYGEIIVELKALGAISNIEIGQVLNYLKATSLKRALLINFGNARIECKRLVV